MPVNLFLIKNIPDSADLSLTEAARKNISKKYSLRNFYILCAFLLQAAIVENFYISGFNELPESFSSAGFILSLILIFYLLILISIYPSVKNNAFFFACILILWGTFAAASSSFSFVFSFLGAVSVILTANIQFTLSNHFRDNVTGVYSANSFKKHDAKKFPPKYTVAFFYIDNYNKILNFFGQAQTDKLTKMVIKRISSLNLPALTYRLKPDEFCFVFFDTDVRQAYELIEEMRRLIACTEFVLSTKKILKITVTPVVSEKRRSDADAFAVLMRMHENFYQKYKFTQNMTFCEEIENMKKTRRSNRL